MFKHGRLTRVGPLRGLIVLAVLLGIGGSIVAAQRSATTADDSPSLAIQGLTTEIHALTATIRLSAAAHLQGQILGIYMGAQQERVSSVTARWEAIRQDIEELSTAATRMTQDAAHLEARISEETDASRRLQMTRELNGYKSEIERLEARQNRLQGREGEVYQAVQSEELKWNELATKLDRLMTQLR